MRKLVYLFVLISTIGYSQDYSGFNGFLTVNDNIWTLRFTNNEYYYYNDPATISFDNVDYAKEFYDDLTYALENKDIVIENPDYKIYSNKKNITLYNNKGQYMIIVKKYLKKGLSDIKNSLAYIK